MNPLTHTPRPGCKDVWNAFMVKDAIFCKHDIPYCPTTAKHIPHRLITWTEARQLHKKHFFNKEYNYSEDAFVTWYIDDYKFDNSQGIWHKPQYVLKILKHFKGAITPDFSTCQDFPESIKLFATYRMRAFGYWLGLNGIEVINNVRWGTSETFDYCFEGIPPESIVAIGTHGGGPRKLVDCSRFEVGLNKMIETLNPHTVIIYGSANADCFKRLEEQGIQLIVFNSSQSKNRRGERKNEQKHKRTL